MRITQVIGGLGGGGAERVCVNLANAWVRGGETVTLVTKREEAPAYALDARVQRRAWASRPPDSIAAVLRTLDELGCADLVDQAASISMMRDAILATEPDVVVAHMDITNVRVLVALYGKGLPVIACEHCDVPRVPAGQWTRLRDVLYRQAAAVVAPHPTIAEHLARRGARAVTIANPLVAPDGTGRPSSAASRHLLPASGEKDLISRDPSSAASRDSSSAASRDSSFAASRDSSSAASRDSSSAASRDSSSAASRHLADGGPSPRSRGEGGAQRRVRGATRHRLVALTRLSIEKRPEMLVCAFEKIAAAHPEWDLEIYGQGPLRQRIETLIDERALRGRVHLRGFADDAYDVLGGADLFVSASCVEAFGNAVWEALACGVPVVAMDCGAPVRSLLRHGVDGIVVGTNSTTALANALASLMGDDAARAALASRAGEVVQRYPIESSLRAWEALLTKVSRDGAPLTAAGRGL